MDRQNLESHLSQVSTIWSVVCRAHDGTAEAVKAAQEALLERYGGAARRYLLAAVRDADAADDLFQEFALRLARGDFHRAAPERGRFRDFLKSALYHLVADHYRRRRAGLRFVPPEKMEPAVMPAAADLDRDFIQNWRDELLARAWQLLAHVEEQTGQPYYTVLRFRADHPDVPSSQAAGQLSDKLARPLTGAGVRQTLHRARDKFADLLLDEVINSLDQPGAEQLEQELIDLGLHEYCRPALDRRR
jgi:RNA polymerase sigma-70 factor (ECF subfamily)